MIDPATGGSASSWAHRRGSGRTGSITGGGRGEGLAVPQLAKRRATTIVTIEEEARMETWLDVVGWEGLYRVSSEGRVSGPRRSILKPFFNRRGYPQVGLYRQGERGRTVFVHRLVAEAFHGPAPAGMECRHLDGDARNPRAENLAWGTHSQNAIDAVKHGANPVGRDHPHAKLTPEAAEIIRRNYQPYCRTWGGRAIAERYGVSTGTVSALIAGVTWKHPAQLQDQMAAQET